MDVGAGLDNLVETATSSSKKKSKKKKKNGRKKKTSDDSREDDSDSDFDSDTDADKNSDSESGGDDVVEEMEVYEKFDVHDRDIEVWLRRVGLYKYAYLPWALWEENNFAKQQLCHLRENARYIMEEKDVSPKMVAEVFKVSHNSLHKMKKVKEVVMRSEFGQPEGSRAYYMVWNCGKLHSIHIFWYLDKLAKPRDKQRSPSIMKVAPYLQAIFSYVLQVPLTPPPPSFVKSPNVQGFSDAKRRKLDWEIPSGDKSKSAMGQGIEFAAAGTDEKVQSAGKCHNMVHDLSLLEMPPRHVCEGCVLGKMHKFAFSQDGSVRATRKLQLVHSDVCCPMRTPSVGNSLYFVTFIDDFSRFCWVYPLKAKSDVFAIFQHYVSMVENETGCKVQTLRTDRGGEYMSCAFKDFLGKKCIKHQCTMPYTPQQNGVAERKNMSLMEMARCMLKAKSLPHKLWMEAVACAAHVLNRCPTRALKTITPYESWYDRKPSVSYLRVFGCLAYAHIPQQLRGKLDDKAIKCIFVGYSSGSKGYRLYNPATNKIFESRDVIFAKTTAQPMAAFDVPHMQTQDVFEGFLPSFVENQESQQVDNFDQFFDQHVTPHDVEEIVREEQEVLREERTLPKWVQKTLQDSKLDAPLPRKTRAAHKEEIQGPQEGGRATPVACLKD
ncbi:hypothetical protein L7F22_054314 [Adiantum nelumboides]|nr:hypothetical protein [Adiantum nelumboides]